MKEHYMVFKEGGYPPKKKHDTLEEALSEARRLAKSELGTFYVMKVLHSVTSSLVITVDEPTYSTTVSQVY